HRISSSWSNIAVNCLNTINHCSIKQCFLSITNLFCYICYYFGYYLLSGWNDIYWKEIYKAKGMEFGRRLGKYELHHSWGTINYRFSHCDDQYFHPGIHCCFLGYFIVFDGYCLNYGGYYGL